MNIDISRSNEAYGMFTISWRKKSIKFTEFVEKANLMSLYQEVMEINLINFLLASLNKVYGRIDTNKNPKNLNSPYIIKKKFAIQL